MRRVNIPLVIILCVSTVVLAVAIFFLHMFQYQRHAVFFLQKAHEAGDAGKAELESRNREAALEKYKEAVELYTRYTNLEPDDTEALTDFGMLLADMGEYGSAYVMLEKVVLLDPERSDVRRRLVKIAMGLRRTRDARDHLEELLRETPKDPELLDLLGTCQMRSEEDGAAIKSFKAALRYGPEQLETYGRLAMVLSKQNGKEKEADAWMDKMVKKNADHPDAYLLRGTYLRGTRADTSELLDADAIAAAEQARLDKGKADAMKALELISTTKKEVSDVVRERALLLNAEYATADKDAKTARKYAKEAVKRFPKSSQAYIALSNVEILDGNRKRGIEWIRKGLTATDGSPDLLFMMAVFLVESNEMEEAIQAVEKLSLSQFPDAMVGYLRGKIDYKQENWNEARARFEQVLPALQAEPRWANAAKDCSYLLATCYQRLGNVDQSVHAMSQAVELDSSWALGRMGHARALLSAGRIDEALQEYEKIMQMPDAPPEGWLDMANVLIAINRRRPEAGRNWRMVDDVLAHAAEALPDAPNVIVLQCEALLAQNRMDEAEKLLLAARDKAPDRFEFWIALIRIAQQQRKWDEVDRLFEEAKKQLGDTVALRLTRGDYFVFRYRGEAGKMLRKLEENAGEFSENDLLLLWSRLSGVARRAGDYQYAGELARRVADKRPNDLQVRIALFELANRAKDLDSMKGILNEMRQIEGEGAYWHLGQGILLARQYKPGREELLDEALKHLSEARVRRPTWGLIPLYTAKVYDQRGDAESAIRYYNLAIEQGERDPSGIHRLVYHLFRQQRYDAADRALLLLKESQAGFPMELSRVWAEIKMLMGQYAQAVELARDAVTDSEDYRNHVWLGQILFRAAGRAKEEGNSALAEQYTRGAEESLQRAVHRAGGVPEVWVALVQFYGTTGKKEKAKEAIAEARLKMPSDEAPLALAYCYEAVGEYQKAAAQYRDVLAGSPDDPALLRQAADFYLRVNVPNQAEPLLRKVLELPRASSEDLVWARRQLARALFPRGTYRAYLDALELIEKNLKLDPSSLYDHRLKARILALRSTRKQRREAIAEFENLLKNEQHGTDEDRFLLSRLYLAEGDWSKASEQMRRLLATSGSEPSYVAAYIQDLLNRGEGRDAQIWVERLVQLAPEEYSTASLQARVLAERGEFDQAVEVLKAFVERPEARPLNEALRLRLAAGTLEGISKSLSAPGLEMASARFAREAEGILRQYVNLEPKNEILLAAFLGRQGRGDEALAVAEHAWTESTPVPIASTCAELLGGGAASEEQFQRVEKILQDALQKYDQAAPLLLTMAELRTLQKNEKEAEALYRKVIEGSEQNVVALNNLAVFLAIRKADPDRAELDEALALINKALDLAGPMSALLDTRGTVYIAMNRWENAIDDLEEAISDDSTAIRQFHLAQAYYGFGDVSAAAKAIKEAQKLGLKVDELQRREAAEYDKLLRELGRTSSSN